MAWNTDKIKEFLNLYDKNVGALLWNDKLYNSWGMSQCQFSPEYSDWQYSRPLFLMSVFQLIDKLVKTLDTNHLKFIIRKYHAVCISQSLFIITRQICAQVFENLNQIIFSTFRRSPTQRTVSFGEMRGPCVKCELA